MSVWTQICEPAHEVVPGTTIRRCTVADLEAAPNLAEVLAEYAAESRLPELGAPHAQVQTYRELEAAGVLFPIAAFEGSRLAGMILVLLAPLPHYGVLVGTAESFFVPKSARKRGTGLRLLAEAEGLANELGARALFVSAPHGGTLSCVLPRRGYRHGNDVFIKPLGVRENAPALLATSPAALERIRRLERLNLERPQKSVLTRHMLHAGMYARTITIEAGDLLTGALIKIPTLLILDGDATVVTGADRAHLIGHHVLAGLAARKQAFLAHAETSLTMVFPTQARSIEEAEAEFTDEAHALFSRRGDNVVSITRETPS